MSVLSFVRWVFYMYSIIFLLEIKKKMQEQKEKRIEKAKKLGE